MRSLDVHWEAQQNLVSTPLLFSRCALFALFSSLAAIHFLPFRCKVKRTTDQNERVRWISKIRRQTSCRLLSMTWPSKGQAKNKKLKLENNYKWDHQTQWTPTEFAVRMTLWIWLHKALPWRQGKFPPSPYSVQFYDEGLFYDWPVRLSQWLQIQNTLYLMHFITTVREMPPVAPGNLDDKSEFFLFFVVFL